MRRVNRLLGFLVALIGFSLAAWAPWAFELLSGRGLPTPVGSNEVAMVVWSGVAFVRVFGALLFGIGTVLWASAAPVPKPRGIQVALFICFLFAALVVSAQQVAIWSNAVGWLLVGLFGVLALLTGVALGRSGERTTSISAG